MKRWELSGTIRGGGIEEEFCEQWDLREEAVAAITQLKAKLATDPSVSITYTIEPVEVSG